MCVYEKEYETRASQSKSKQASERELALLVLFGLVCVGGSLRRREPFIARVWRESKVHFLTLLVLLSPSTSRLIRPPRPCVTAPITNSPSSDAGVGSELSSTLYPSRPLPLFQARLDWPPCGTRPSFFRGSNQPLDISCLIHHFANLHTASIFVSISPAPAPITFAPASPHQQHLISPPWRLRRVRPLPVPSTVSCRNWPSWAKRNGST